jgi:hypothetical protein
LNDAPNQTEFQFVVTYGKKELRAYQKLMAGRYARAQSEGTGFGILLAAILVLGLAVSGAFKLGFVEPSAVRPVLYAAYFAFLTGVVGYYFVMRAYFRKFLRTDLRGGTWNCIFTPYEILYSSTNLIEVRLSWRAVSVVENLRGLVIFRFGAQGLIIPSRVFANDAARLAFRSAVSAWIESAAQSP